MSHKQRGKQLKKQKEDEGISPGAAAVVATIVGGLVGAAVTYFSQSAAKNELTNECRVKDEQLKQLEQEYRNKNARLRQRERECAKLRREQNKVELINSQLSGDCSICLNSFSDTTVSQLKILKCGHAIHKHCFRQLTDNRCPICRQQF